MAGEVTAPNGRLERAGPRLSRAVGDRTNACMNDRTHTHEAGLDRDHEGGAGEAVIACPAGTFADSHDFRMSGRIPGTDGLIEAAADHLVTERDDRTNRHFTTFSSQPGLNERLIHELVVRHLLRSAFPCPVSRVPCPCIYASE